MVEPAARYEEVQIPLEEPAHGLDSVSGMLGIPEWWPTGSRVGLVLAHGASRDATDPLLAELQRCLTERKYLSLRFNFPFGEAKKRRPDPAAALERTYRAAIGVLGRDPTAAPAHLLVGGIGLGGIVAAQIATARLRVDGVYFLSYPLHKRDEPEENVQADPLFRIVAPMLFIQGTRDRQCDLEALRRTLTRVGAPTTLHVVQDADQRLHVPKRSERTQEQVLDEIVGTLDAWCTRVVEP